MDSINEPNINNKNLNINNEINHLFDKAFKTINIASIINLIITAIVIIIVIANIIISGFNNYHAMLIQLIILNILFIITINYTISDAYCGITQMINVRNQISYSYNILHNADNNI